MIGDAMHVPPAKAPRLRDRVLRAGGWSLTGYAVAQAIRLLTSLVMTRLLVPEMFGVMAIAAMFMTALGVFSDVGLRPSVVRSDRGGEPAFLNTVWITQILRGILIASAALCVALALAASQNLELLSAGSAYGAPVLPGVIAALGATAIVTGLESTRLLEGTRRVSIGRVTQIEIASQVASVAFMLSLATATRSIWVLVAGSAVSAAARTLLSHVWLRGTPNRFEWDRTAFREIVRFGKWIFLSSGLWFFASVGDRVILGGLVSAAMLGVYSIAVTILTAVEAVFERIVSGVAFPALSEVARERRDDLRKASYRFHWVIAGGAYVCAGMLLVSGQDIVSVLYDPRYRQAGSMLQVLAVSLLAVPCRLANVCLLALGESRMHSHVVATRVAVLLVALPVGFGSFGLMGGMWGIVLSHLAAVPVALTYAARFGLLRPWREIAMLFAFPLGMLGGLVLARAIGH